MGKLSKLAKKSKRSIRKAYDKVETEVMAAVGRKALRTKAKAVASAGREVAKTALKAGAMAAAGAVAHEIRRRSRKA